MGEKHPLRQIIQEMAQKIVSEYHPEKIILFGSQAHGQPGEMSDIDLLIIKNTSKRPLERWMEVKRLLRDPQRMVSVSPIVYTPEEIEERLAIKDFFIQDVLEKGEKLYG